MRTLGFPSSHGLRVRGGRLVIVGAALAASANAQSFSYANFTGATNLVTNGAAAISGSALRVTSATISEKGSVWYNQRVRVAAGFETTFEFSITAQSGGGGDGMAFVIHEDTSGTAALGDHASAMGYGAFVSSPTTNAVGNSLVFEIDTFDNGASWGDTSGNQISIHTNGSGDNSQHEDYSIASNVPVSNMSDGAIHTMRIRYAAGTIEVYLDDLTTPLFSVPWSFATGGTWLNGNSVGAPALMGGTAWVGFTAGNGGAWENHDVHSWTWDYPFFGTNYCGPAVANTTGGAASILASGSATVAVNNLTLAASGMPANQFGIFITSLAQGFVPGPGGSQGNLCLGGGIGRYNAPGQILNSGPQGAFSLALNLNATPTPAGPVAVVAGETRHFQAWYRDLIPGQGAVSNFTDGLTVVFL